MNNFIKENWFKLSFAIAVILIGISVFYYFVIFIPQKEKVKIESAELEKVSAEERAKEEKAIAKESLDNCLMDAERNYQSLWNDECKEIGNLSAECKEIIDLTFNEYLEKHNITVDDYEKKRGITERFGGVLDFITRRDECSCRLPTRTADRFGGILQDNKDECFKRYPQ